LPRPPPFPTRRSSDLLIAPGEFTVIVGGVIAGQGTIEIVPLLALVWACCIAGDTTSFFVGRRLGRSFLEKHGSKVKITPERLVQDRKSTRLNSSHQII